MSKTVEAPPIATLIPPPAKLYDRRSVDSIEGLSQDEKKQLRSSITRLKLRFLDETNYWRDQLPQAKENFVAELSAACPFIPNRYEAAWPIDAILTSHLRNSHSSKKAAKKRQAQREQAGPRRSNRTRVATTRATFSKPPRKRMVQHKSNTKKASRLAPAEAVSASSSTHIARCSGIPEIAKDNKVSLDGNGRQLGKTFSRAQTCPPRFAEVTDSDREAAGSRQLAPLLGTPIATANSALGDITAETVVGLDMTLELDGLAYPMDDDESTPFAAGYAGGALGAVEHGTSSTSGPVGNVSHPLTASTPDHPTQASASFIALTAATAVPHEATVHAHSTASTSISASIVHLEPDTMVANELSDAEPAAARSSSPRWLAAHQALPAPFLTTSGISSSSTHPRPSVESPSPVIALLQAVGPCYATAENIRKFVEADVTDRAALVMVSRLPAGEQLKFFREDVGMDALGSRALRAALKSYLSTA